MPRLSSLAVGTVLVASAYLQGAAALKAEGGQSWYMPHSQLFKGQKGRWELLNSLVDGTPGSYSDLMEPTVAAVSISYYAANGPDFNDSYVNKSLGGKWERLYDLEVDPKSTDAGIHAFAFVRRDIKRAILAFRGSCLDVTQPQCRADRCVISGFHTFGDVTSDVFGNSSTNKCGEFSSDQLDYLGQAEKLAKRLQDHLPGYKLLLTGHSLGGFLAAVTAGAAGRGHYQALMFAPTPFRDVLAARVKAKGEQAVGQEEMVAVCDPYDCGINSKVDHQAPGGTDTCVFDKWVKPTEPEECEGVDPLKQEAKALLCKSDSHSWKRYQSLLLLGEDLRTIREHGGANCGGWCSQNKELWANKCGWKACSGCPACNANPAAVMKEYNGAMKPQVLPTCREKLSTNILNLAKGVGTDTTDLAKTMRFAVMPPMKHTTPEPLDFGMVPDLQADSKWDPAHNPYMIGPGNVDANMMGHIPEELIEH